MGEAAALGRRVFFLLGWIGSAALDLALALVPCGCEHAVEALAQPDDEARDVIARQAPALQRRWRCPSAGYQPAASRDELDPQCRAALRRVDALAGGLDCGTTCPRAASRDPAAHVVIGARAWRDAGALRERVGWPSLALCEAIDAVDRGYAARTAAEQKDRDRENEERARRAAANTR